MSRVQERIQENERLLTIDRQSLAHMENSSWRHMDDLHCALGGVPEQGPSLFERPIRRMKALGDLDIVSHLDIDGHDFEALAGLGHNRPTEGMRPFLGCV